MVLVRLQQVELAFGDHVLLDKIELLQSLLQSVLHDIKESDIGIQYRH
jgi:hypothetical protein